MLPQPEVYLHDLTEEEKKQLVAIARKRLKLSLITMLPLSLIALAGAILANVYKYQLKLDRDENVHAAINIGLVLVFALCARLVVTQIVNLNKESKAWQKRVVHGKIHGMKGRTVFIGKQSVKLDAANADKVKVDDEVEISISTHAEFIISVIKRNG